MLTFKISTFVAANEWIFLEDVNGEWLQIEQKNAPEEGQITIAQFSDNAVFFEEKILPASRLTQWLYLPSPPVFEGKNRKIGFILQNQFLTIPNWSLSIYESDFMSSSPIEAPPKVEQDWQAVTLFNGWQHYDAVFPGSNLSPPGYWKDSLGVVHLRGIIASGVLNAAIFSLPSGYRPEYTEIHTGMSGDSNAIYSLARIDISAAGVVLAQSGGTDYLSLDGITFRAV